MGIDIRTGGRRVGHKNRTEPKSDNVYVGLLHKVRVASTKRRRSEGTLQYCVCVYTRTPRFSLSIWHCAIGRVIYVLCPTSTYLLRVRTRNQATVPVVLPLQLYTFLARRTDSGFNAIVAKRLTSSRSNRPSMGLARIARYMKGKADKIAVVVSTVTDDVRLEGLPLPAMKIAALRFTEKARARIEKAGGEVLTFDQLALLRPKGENTVLLRGRKSARTSAKYFGAPGVPNSTTRPRVRAKGRKVRYK